MVIAHSAVFYPSETVRLYISKFLPFWHQGRFDFGKKTEKFEIISDVSVYILVTEPKSFVTVTNYVINVKDIEDLYSHNVKLH